MDMKALPEFKTVSNPGAEFLQAACGFDDMSFMSLA